MEDVNPPIIHSNDLHSDNGFATEAQFIELCKTGLSLNECIFTQAMQLLKDCMTGFGIETQENVERLWFAFALYTVKRLTDKREDNSTHENRITLSQTLKVLKLNIVDFFKELPQFIIMSGPILSNRYGSDWEKRLEAKELQTSFVHLIHLGKFYKRAYLELFLASDASNTGYVSDYHRFGWLLFLALRVHVFSPFQDLVTYTNALVSIITILIIHVPTQFRKFDINDYPGFVKKGNKVVDLLGSLCNIFDTSEDELRTTMEKTNTLIADLLKKKPCPGSKCTSENLKSIDTDGLMYLKDLMEESSLTSSLDTLEKDYENEISKNGELDERMFANEDSLLGSGDLSTNITGVKRKIDSIHSPQKAFTSGGANSKMAAAATPVSTTMTTAKWVRSVISPLPSKPSPWLQHFLSSCDKDVTSDVIRRADIILEAIFPCTSSYYITWAQQRKLDALKLYYKVLQAICTAEAKILQGNNLTCLLTNERFHRCMLACSAEIILATHKTVTMLFPTVLEKTGITAFDLSKVIESFIRHEDSLPRELKRHLNSLEERLLESMVWERNSSLYNSLIVAKPDLSSEINRVGLLAEPMPSLDSISMLNTISSPSGNNGDMRSPKRICTNYRSVLIERNSFVSPVKDRLLAFNNNPKAKLLPHLLQSEFVSPSKPILGGEGETCAEMGINIFFCKITKLAAVRINGMIERLEMSEQIRDNVYCVFQKILHHQTTLFFNRHIDQIILCCFYAVAKVSQLKLTLKDLIYNYRKQPHCKPQVYTSVFVDRSLARHNGRNEHIDIKAFYNDIFIPTAKRLLMEVDPAGTWAQNHGFLVCSPAGSPSKRCSKFPSVPDMSPKKVSAAHNVYVSPFRSSKTDALISCSSKSYYACLGESTHAYQSPSKDLTAINNRLNSNSTRKALRFNEEGDEVRFVSDEMVANSSLFFFLQNAAAATAAAAISSTSLL